MRCEAAETKKLDPGPANAGKMKPMRLIALAVVAALLTLAAILFATSGPVHADAAQSLYISGLRVAADKPVSIVRLTNTSPDAADVFYVHYTIHDAASGAAVSRLAAGDGAQLRAGRTLELDLGAIIAQYRQSLDVTSTYSGAVQLTAYGEGGYYHSFGSGVIHVEVEQHEGAAIHDGAVQWLSQ
jgi:hypothetical protein